MSFAGKKASRLVSAVLMRARLSVLCWRVNNSGFSRLFAVLGFCLIACLLLSSCASPYRPLKHRSGYSEQPVGKNEYEITFLGKGSATYDQALDFALLRSAEIALKQQASEFAVLNVVNLSSARKYTAASHQFWTASRYQSNEGAVVPSAPEFSIGTDENFHMMEFAEERVYYRPGVRLRIMLSPEPQSGLNVQQAASLREELTKKYHLN
jgi:hypothetical protein